MLPYVLFLALVVVFLWKPIFTGAALLPGDYLAKMSPWNTVIKAPNPEPQWNPLQWDAIAQFYPWRVFYARSMSSGHIPLWNPHQFCGTPFLANGQSAVLYPLNLIFLIFDPITAFTIFAALHMFLAVSFTYLLMRELGCKELGGIVSGICFAFSAFMVLWLELPTFIAVATWLPLILLLIYRSVERHSIFHGMLAGAVMAIAILAGHFQIAFYVMFAAILWWLWKLIAVWREDGKLYAAVRVGAPFVAFLVIAGLIAAPQIIPTQELAMNSHRVREVTAEGYDRFLSNAVAPYRLITAFAPDFFGSPAKNNYTLLGNLNGHIGSAADYMEYGTYIGILPLMLAVIALMQIRKRRHVGFFAVLGLMAILAATGTPINAIFYYFIPGFSALGGPNRILLLYLFSMAALAGFGIDRFNEFATYRIRMYKVLMPLVVAIIVADLFAFGINYNPTCDRSNVYPRTQLTDTLKKIAGNSRIAPINPNWSLFETPNAILPPNAAMVYGLYDVQGYDSLYTKAYKDLSSRVQGEDSSPPENGNMVLFRRYTSDLPIFAGYVIRPDPFVENDPLRLMPFSLADGVYVYSSRRVNQVAQISANQEVLNVLMAYHRPLKHEGPNRVSQYVFGPEHWRGPIGGGTVNYPGWAATCRGQHLRIAADTTGLQTADFITGPTRVTFSFKPFSFRFGLFLMLIGVSSLSMVGVYHGMKYNKRSR